MGGSAGGARGSAGNAGDPFVSCPDVFFSRILTSVEQRSFLCPSGCVSVRDALCRWDEKSMKTAAVSSPRTGAATRAAAARIAEVFAFAVERVIPVGDIDRHIVPDAVLAGQVRRSVFCFFQVGPETLFALLPGNSEGDDPFRTLCLCHPGGKQHIAAAENTAGGGHVLPGLQLGPAGSAPEFGHVHFTGVFGGIGKVRDVFLFPQFRQRMDAASMSYTRAPPQSGQAILIPKAVF